MNYQDANGKQVEAFEMHATAGRDYDGWPTWIKEGVSRGTIYQHEASLLVKTAAGFKEGEVGDWIVRDGDGMQIIGADAFTAAYVQTDV